MSSTETIRQMQEKLQDFYGELLVWCVSFSPPNSTANNPYMTRGEAMLKQLAEGKFPEGYEWYVSKLATSIIESLVGLSSFTYKSGNPPADTFWLS